MSEPTTGEIVRALRNCFERSNVNGICMKCEFTGTKGKYAIDADECGYGCETNLVKYAINRLESQERELSEKTEQLEYTNRQYDLAVADVEKLTALAEQAERERDALISSIERLRTKKIELCSICEFEDLIGCCHKNHCEGYQLFKRRGLPQAGEGV